MNKIVLLFIVFWANVGRTQSFPPAAGIAGSTAISKDSSVFVAWADNLIIERGYLDIAFPDLGFASFGSDTNALHHPEGNSVDVVSLGDGGTAVLTFNSSIFNGPGPDFAIFENGFADNYLELAFVEVSSDGVNFVRFPAISESPTTTQIGPFEYSDCRYVHNLAGKYRQGFGTPFDLEDLIDSVGIDLNAITHIKLIDVVGSIDTLFGTYDSQGNIINDLYPTPFESGGFDLDGIGVIHQNSAKMEETTFEFSMFPNPTQDFLFIHSKEKTTISIQDLSGRSLFFSHSNYNHEISLIDFESQLLIVTISNEKTSSVRKIMKH